MKMPGMKVIRVGQDLLVRVGLDSINKRALTFDKDELINQAAISGVWYFFLKDQLIMRFNPLNTFGMSFAIEVLGRTGIIAASKMFRGRELNLMKMIMEQTVFSGASLIGANFINSFRQRGQNNKSTSESDQPQANEASQPIPPPVNPNNAGRFGPDPFGLFL